MLKTPAPVVGDRRFLFLKVNVSLVKLSLPAGVSVERFLAFHRPLTVCIVVSDRFANDSFRLRAEAIATFAAAYFVPESFCGGAIRTIFAATLKRRLQFSTFGIFENFVRSTVFRKGMD